MVGISDVVGFTSARFSCTGGIVKFSSGDVSRNPP